MEEKLGQIGSNYKRELETMLWKMAINKLNKTYVNSQTKLNAEDFQENVNKIDELVDFANKEVLWQNSNSNVSFEPQTITLSSDNYEALLWIFKFSITENLSLSAISKKGMGLWIGYGNGLNGDNLSRVISRVDDKNFSLNDTLINGRVSNNTFIPLCILKLY